LKVRFSRTARADLKAAFDFIYPDSPRAAEAVFLAILDATDSLAEFPNRGRVGLLPGSRELVVTATGHIISYIVADGVVTVLRIQHGREDRTS